MKSLIPTVAFLGPEGTFAHITAQKRYGDGAKLVPEANITEVFSAVAENRATLGVVPIENSSGGTIFETLECLAEPSNQLKVQEVLSINVRLALLGKEKKKIKVIYSHFAPLHHCEKWINKHFPDAEVHKFSSTAAAIQKAVETPNAAAIGSRDAAKRYGLKILEFPIEQDIKNVTQFFVLGQQYSLLEDSTKTTICFTLPNHSGSLYDFLTPFKDEGVNLTRIVSRPIMGEPDAYIFLADISGTQSQTNVKKALDRASKLTSTIKNLGSYPVRKTFDS